MSKNKINIDEQTLLNWISTNPEAAERILSSNTLQSKLQEANKKKLEPLLKEYETLKGQMETLAARIKSAGGQLPGRKRIDIEIVNLLKSEGPMDSDSIVEKLKDEFDQDKILKTLDKSGKGRSQIVKNSEGQYISKK